MRFRHVGRRAYTAAMDDNTLRVVLAAVLAPLFWGLMRWLWSRLAALVPGARERAARERSRREQSLQGSYSLGRQLGRWLGGRAGRRKR